MTYRKKLIEVALPLDAINREASREKSIRHGHPSTVMRDVYPFTHHASRITNTDITDWGNSFRLQFRAICGIFYLISRTLLSGEKES